MLLKTCEWDVFEGMFGGSLKWRTCGDGAHRAVTKTISVDPGRAMRFEKSYCLYHWMMAYGKSFTGEGK